MGFLSGLFGGEKEQERLGSLRQLEDKRLRFAQQLHQASILPTEALFVQVGGGFFGLAIFAGELYLISGPAPGEVDGQFTIQKGSARSVRFEPFSIPSEGGGGMFGFGKKGGVGYRVIATGEDGVQRNVECVPALQCILNVENALPALLSEVRRKGNANYVWDFQAMQPQGMDKIVARWTAMLAELP